MADTIKISLNCSSSQIMDATQTLNYFQPGLDLSEEPIGIDSIIAFTCTDGIVIEAKYMGINVLPLAMALSQYGGMHYTQYNRPFNVNDFAMALAATFKGANDLRINKMYTVLSFNVIR